MRIGVVGLGFMGSTHLQAYARIPTAELTAVASSDERKLSGDLSGVKGNLAIPETRMDFLSVTKHKTAESLFSDPRVEAVDLCVPTDLHRPLSEAALSAGKHVLVEKPMALTAADCDAMVEQARRSGKVLMVAHVLRYWPDYLAARSLVKQGSFGRIRAARFERRCAAPAWGGWLSDPKRSGGAVVDLLIHDFDFCIHLFGKPTGVQATGTEQISSGIDCVDARIIFENDVHVSVSGGWLSGDYPFMMGFRVVGEEGTLEFDTGGRRLTAFRKSGQPEVLPLPEKEAFQGELEAFVDACREGEPPTECPPEESALAVRIALAVLESRTAHGELVLIN